MRDPHVAAVRYRLVPVETVTFDQPPPLEWDTEAFRMRLADGIARFEMLEHHPSVETARQRVETYLRAWEVYVALHFGRPEFRFEFEGEEVIDRDPPPPGTPQLVSVGKTLTAIWAVAAPTVHVTRRKYHDPPARFVLSPDAESMWHRYEGYCKGQEPLASMGYACLTLLQASSQGRPGAANRYGISKNVLDTLAHLTSEVGDVQSARKFDTGRSLRPHNEVERAWIEAAVKALILRVGEWAFDPEAPRPMVTMNNLPKLPPS